MSSSPESPFACSGSLRSACAAFAFLGTVFGTYVAGGHTYKRVDAKIDMAVGDAA